MINEISTALMGTGIGEVLAGLSRGEELEDKLTEVCNLLGEVGDLTEGKADVELLTSIVATYLISVSNGSIPDEAQPPSVLFDEIVFPQLDDFTEVVVEEIPEDEQLTHLPT